MITASLDRDRNYTAVVLAFAERPKEHGGVPVRDVNLLQVGSTVVPWPNGMTAEEALLAWAKEQSLSLIKELNAAHAAALKELRSRYAPPTNTGPFLGSVAKESNV